MPNQEANWTKGEYLSLCGVMSNTGWFQIHKAILIDLGIEPAVLLQFLMNFHTGVQKSKYYKWQDGWFFCTVESVEKEIGISRRVQFRLLSVLTESGCIEIKKSGMPAKRYIRINPTIVHKIVVDWLEKKDYLSSHDDQNVTTSQHQTVPTSQHQTVPTYSKTEFSKTLLNNTLSEQKSSDDKCEISKTSKPTLPGKNGSVDSGKSKKTKITDFDKIATDKLREMVSKFKGREIQIRGWADNFRKLRTSDKVPQEKIKEVLLWYKKNIGGDFIPEAFCGSTFKKKFGQIEAAMRKDGKPQKEEWHDKEIEYFDKPSGKWYKRDILQLYLSKFQKRHGPLKQVNQEDLDALLLENGMNVGELTASGVSNG